jgi:uncharacterized membrane protein
MIDVLPEWVQIFLLSMIPGLESRYVIPFVAIHEFGWIWWQAFPIAVAGNLLLVPFILRFFKNVELFLVRFPRWKKAMDWGFPIIRRRADSKISTYETIALVFFVAVPLPFTGAGLGSLIAVLFDLRFSHSLLMIFIGVITSSSITTLIYLTGSFLLG